MDSRKSFGRDSLQSWGWDGRWRKEFEPHEGLGWRPARFENYLKLQQELAFQTRRRDEHQAREEKQRTKSVHRLLRRRIAEKTRGRK